MVDRNKSWGVLFFVVTRCDVIPPRTCCRIVESSLTPFISFKLYRNCETTHTPHCNLFPAQISTEAESEEQSLRHISAVRKSKPKVSWGKILQKSPFVMSDNQTDFRIYKCQLSVPIRRGCSRFLQLHQHTVTVFRVKEHHWFPMSTYSRLWRQSSDVPGFQVGDCSIDVVNLQWKNKVIQIWKLCICWMFELCLKHKSEDKWFN